MQWTKPDFQEITLGMEVTAYVNTDRAAAWGEQLPPDLTDALPANRDREGAEQVTTAP
jgi:coenzyme PQQ precursor peptide PqqA